MKNGYFRKKSLSIFLIPFPFPVTLKVAVSPWLFFSFAKRRTQTNVRRLVLRHVVPHGLVTKPQPK